MTCVKWVEEHDSNAYFALMDTKLLSVFFEVLRSGGFAAAARRLAQDPSSVSRAIASLEEDLGVRLFQRTTRTVSLTEAGSRFAARIEPILAELDQARDDLRGETARPTGRLSLSASVAFGQVCIMPHIPDFLALYPEIDLDLKFTDRNVDLVAEQIDLAVRMGPSVTADVIAARLTTIRYRVCASPAYLEKYGPVVEPSGLKNRPCVCFDLPQFNSRWRFRQRSDAPASESQIVEIGITPALTVSGALTIREGALLGIGPALLADWIIDQDIEEGRLVDIFPDWEVTATSFDPAAWILYPSRSFLPRKTRVMIDFLRDRLRR